jgi:hypothetical protein
MLESTNVAVEAAAEWIRHFRVDASRMCVVALDELGMLLSTPGIFDYDERAALYRAAVEADFSEVAFALLEGSQPEEEGFEPERPLIPGGKPLTLGERKFLARGRRDQKWLHLLADPHPHVVEIILENPHLTETDVITMASRRPSSPSSLMPIYRNRRFRTRPRVKRALALNPATPAEVVARLVLSLPDKDVSEVANDRTRPAPLRLHARRVVEVRI